MLACIMMYRKVENMQKDEITRLPLYPRRPNILTAMSSEVFIRNSMFLKQTFQKNI